jgi:short-subunit dehydrogenase
MSPTNGPLAEKVIVITGASGGIGAELAQVVAGRGAKPVLCARREPELRAVAARCGGDALALVADQTQRVGAEALCRLALERHGRIDVWVNNVGRGITRLPSQLTDGDLDEMLLVNVKSAWYGVQAVLPHFRERDAGQIVNVSSMLGRMPYLPARSAYSAAKHFLSSLTANLRMELSATHPGICVTLVSPGVVATEFGLRALHGGADSRSFSQAQDPREVAEVIAEAIERRQTDVYTRPAYRQQVVDYYASLVK